MCIFEKGNYLGGNNILIFEEQSDVLFPFNSDMLKITNKALLKWTDCWIFLNVQNIEGKI